MSNAISTSAEFLYSVVDLSTDSTTVYADPVLVRGLYINTANVSALPIKDGTTTVFTIPAGSVAGSCFPLWDALFSTSLVVDPDNSDTGSITIVYKPTDIA